MERKKTNSIISIRRMLCLYIVGIFVVRPRRYPEISLKDKILNLGWNQRWTFGPRFCPEVLSRRDQSRSYPEVNLGRRDLEFTPRSLSADRIVAGFCGASRSPRGFNKEGINLGYPEDERILFTYRCFG